MMALMVDLMIAFGDLTGGLDDALMVAFGGLDAGLDVNLYGVLCWGFECCLKGGLDGGLDNGLGVF